MELLNLAKYLLTSAFLPDQDKLEFDFKEIEKREEFLRMIRGENKENCNE